MIHAFKVHHKVSRDLSDVPSTIKLLLGAFFTYYLAWGIIQPYIPIYIESRVANYSEVGIVFSALFIFYAVFSIPVGRLIELVGRKRMMTFSFLHYVIMGPLYIMASNIWVLFLARIYNGFAAASLWVPFKTYARDKSPPHKEAEIMGLFHTTVHTALVAGALVAALLVTIMPVENLFYSLMIFPVLALILTSRLKDTVRHRESFYKGVRDVMTRTSYFKRDLKRVFSNSLAKRTAVAYFNAYFVTSSLTMVLALFAREFGAELWQIGVIYAGFFLPTISAFVFGDLADNGSRSNVLRNGLIAACILLFMMSLTSNIAYMFGVVLFVSLSMAAVVPVAESVVSDIAGNHKGETTAVFEAINSFGMGMGPIVSGLVADVFSLSSVFIMLSVLMFGTMLFMSKVNLD